MAKDNQIDRRLIRTRLADSDYLEFRQLADSRNLNQNQLAREAIVYYLRALKQQRLNDELAPYTRQLQASTERICALLARVAIDTRSICIFSANVHGDMHQLAQARNVAIKQIGNKLDATERSITDSFARIILAPELPFSDGLV